MTLERPAESDRSWIGPIVGLFCLLAVGAITWARLPYGVDVMDESFYAVIPLRFVHGARPFVDEANLAQTAFFLTTPLVRLWGTPDGLILALRQAWFVFALLVVGGVAWGLTRLTSWPRALLLALPCLAFVPFNLPAPSYDTLGMGFFTLGLYLGGVGSADPNRTWLAGLAHGLAVACYPPWGVAVLTCCAVWPGRRLEYLAAVAVGSLPCVIPMLVAGVPQVLSDLRYIQSFHGPPRVTWAHSVSLTAMLGLTAYLIGLWRATPGWRQALLLAMPIVPFFFLGLFDILGSLNVVAVYGLLSTVAVHYLPHGKPLLRTIGLPSAVAAGVALASSSVGPAVTGVGLLPAAILTSYVLLEGLTASMTVGRRILPLVPAMLFAAGLVFLQFGLTYNDDYIDKLTTLIRTGPYRGLYTSPEKAAVLSQFASDMAGVGPSDTILVYDLFSAGYLLANQPVLTNSAWLQPLMLAPQANRQATLDYFQSQGEWPTVVVRMKHIMMTADFSFNPRYTDEDPLDRMVVGPQYRKVIERDGYDVYRRVVSSGGNSSCAGSAPPAPGGRARSPGPG